MFASKNELNTFYGLTQEGTLAKIAFEENLLQQLAPKSYQTGPAVDIEFGIYARNFEKVYSSLIELSVAANDNEYENTVPLTLLLYVLAGKSCKI